MPEYERARKTKNGVDIYSYKNPALHSFYISAFIKAGCMYEDEKYAGITHFLEHALIRNVNKLYDGTLYGTLDRRGIEFNASTYSEMVQFYVSGASSNFSTGAEIISKILHPITLDKSEIDAERKRIKAEIRESDDKNSLASFTGRIVFEGTPLASSIIGTNAAIDGISAVRLEKYRCEACTAGNIFFYVTGNFTDSDLDGLAALIEGAAISDGAPVRRNLAPVPEKFGKRGGGVYVKNADFTMARFTFDLDMSAVSFAECDLLYDILLSGYDSPLFIEMSEKRGLFYDINGALERYGNIGTLNFSFELRGKNLAEATELVVDILNRIKHGEGIGRECMKAGYVDNAYMLYDDPRELNFTFAYDNHIMGANYASVEERRERYAAITEADIARAAAEIFKPSNLTVTVKGDRKSLNTEEINKIVERLV